MSNNLTNYSSGQDTSNAFAEYWATTLEPLVAQYSPVDRVVGKTAEAMLQGGGDSYNFLTVVENETQEIDPFVNQTVPASAVVKDLLVLDQTSEYLFQRDEDEMKLQQFTESFYGRHSQAALKQHMRDFDGNVLMDAFLAGVTLTDGDFGGTAGDAVSLTKGTIADVAFDTQAIINEAAQESGQMAILYTSRLVSLLAASGYANGSNVSDQMFNSGLRGFSDPKIQSTLGLDTYQTLITPHGRDMVFTSNAANGNTITIGGVAATIVSTLTGANLEILRGANTAATLENIAAFAQDPTGNTATFKGAVKNSAAAKALRKYSAKKVSDTVLTVVSKFGEFVVAPVTNITGVTVSTDTDIYLLATHYGAIETACPAGIRLNSGMNNTGTIEQFSSRKRWGTAIPTNKINKFRFIKARRG